MSRRLFWLTAGGLLAANTLSLLGLFLATDISTYFSRNAAQAEAGYLARIAALRVEVDRLHSRRYAETGNLNLALHELSEQQQVLNEQHEYVRLLAAKAGELGLPTAIDVATAPAETVLPQPVSATTDTADAISETAERISSMMRDNERALAAIASTADRSADEIVTALNRVGISTPKPEPDGVGGPFIPASAAPPTDGLADRANDVLRALTRFDTAVSAFGQAPVHYPMTTYHRVSSNYGRRTDPFSGKKAYHSGIDYAAPTGTPVISAGTGEVVFSGTTGGYGKMVEVEHRSGLVTRYAHLSATLVSVGDHIDTGDTVGRVGSTGRSTGPHLHFEVRRDDKSVDPAPFLRIGKRLSDYL